MNTGPERFLTLKEAAQVLQFHPKTIRAYVRRGELVGRVIGGRWRFRRNDLDTFFDRAPSQWEFSRGPETRGVNGKSGPRLGRSLPRRLAR